MPVAEFRNCRGLVTDYKIIVPNGSINGS